MLSLKKYINNVFVLSRLSHLGFAASSIFVFFCVPFPYILGATGMEKSNVTFHTISLFFSPFSLVSPNFGSWRMRISSLYRFRGSVRLFLLWFLFPFFSLFLFAFSQKPFFSWLHLYFCTNSYVAAAINNILQKKVTICHPTFAATQSISTRRPLLTEQSLSISAKWNEGKSVFSNLFSFSL